MSSESGAFPETLGTRWEDKTSVYYGASCTDIHILIYTYKQFSIAVPNISMVVYNWR